MLGSVEISADGLQAHFTQATSLVFHMTLFLLVLLFHFSTEQSLASRPSQCFDFPLCCAHVFPACECMPVAGQLAAGAQQGLRAAGAQHGMCVCPPPSIRGKHKGLHRHPQPAANIQTRLGQEFCFAKHLQNTTVLFSFEFLHSPQI